MNNLQENKQSIIDSIMNTKYEPKWVIWDKKSFLFLDKQGSFTCKNQNSKDAQVFETSEDVLAKIDELNQAGVQDLFHILVNIPINNN